MAASQISGVRTVESGRGKTFEVEYYAETADLDSIVPEIGSIATWAPETAIVSDYRKEPIGHDGTGAWRVFITAEPSDDDTETNFDPVELDKNVKPNYSLTDLYFPMEWFGIVKASKKDQSNGILNIYGEACRKDDFLFRNATNLSAGDANYKKSPFRNTSSITTDLVERKIKIPLYTVTFYTRKTASAFTRFQGVNPSGGFATAHRPVSEFSTDAEKWRAVDQQVEPVLNRKRIQYWKVIRMMEYAPGTAHWDADKNLGSWVWLT